MKQLIVVECFDTPGFFHIYEIEISQAEYDKLPHKEMWCGEPEDIAEEIERRLTEKIND